LADLPAAASGKTALSVARQAAQAAAEIMLAAYRHPMNKTAKRRGDFLTEFDLACEKATMALLTDEYPDIPVLGEETSSVAENWREGWLWVVDPIDGTSNFARGIPTFCFNIGLCHDGEPVLGVTLQPVTGDEWIAVAGGGLTLNGAPARVSDAGKLEDALLGFGLGYSYSRSKMLLTLLADLWPAIQMAQNIGSAALGLSYTASGRFDIYAHSFLAPWDMVAGILQVREAGGLALDRSGEPVTIYSEGIVAGAPGPVREFVTATKNRAWR
jgi:fructose-1,6-bisphosphatase/inositol monophosphatase family enzyme